MVEPYDGPEDTNNNRKKATSKIDLKSTYSVNGSSRQLQVFWCFQNIVLSTVFALCGLNTSEIKRSDFFALNSFIILQPTLFWFRFRIDMQDYWLCLIVQKSPAKLQENVPICSTVTTSTPMRPNLQMDSITFQMLFWFVSKLDVAPVNILSKIYIDVSSHSIITSVQSLPSIKWDISRILQDSLHVGYLSLTLANDIKRSCPG